jgi:hypothetical protein
VVWWQNGELAAAAAAARETAAAAAAAAADALNTERTERIRLAGQLADQHKQHRAALEVRSWTSFSDVRI